MSAHVSDYLYTHPFGFVCAPPYEWQLHTALPTLCRCHYCTAAVAPILRSCVLHTGRIRRPIRMPLEWKFPPWRGCKFSADRKVSHISCICAQNQYVFFTVIVRCVTLVAVVIGAVAVSLVTLYVQRQASAGGGVVSRDSKLEL